MNHWLFRSVRTLSGWGKWIAILTIGFMMLLICFYVTQREFFTPIRGNVEILELSMVVIIMFGLGYSQSENAHISIGLLVDRFPQRAQFAIDVAAYVCTAAVSIFIGWIMLQAAMEEMSGQGQATMLLKIPFYPFKFIIAIGFALWALEALLKAIESVSGMRKRSS